MRPLARVAASLLGALLAAGAAAQGPPPPPEADPAARAGPPNLVLILADDLGYRDVGAYGNEVIRTPSLDALAQGGLRFTQGYVSAPLCAPMRAGLLTGRVHNRYGYGNPGSALDEQRTGSGVSVKEVLLSEELRRAGYATGIFGKWHLGSRRRFRPQARGFDVFFGMLGGGHDYFDWGTGLWGPIHRGDTPVEDGGYLTDAITKEAVGFVRAHRDRPFFAYVAYNAVHGPLQAPEADLARYPALDPRQRLYAAMVSALDRGVGAILQALRETGLAGNTLVVFLSDNGGSIFVSDLGGLRGQKGSLLEGGIRVPFLMRWPGRLPAGVPYTHPVSSLDLFPTLLAAAGVERRGRRPLDGVDLLPHLTGRRAGPPHETLYWKFRDDWAVRRGAWKLVRLEDRERGPVLALYDLAADPGEARDLSSEHPGQVAELRAAFEAWSASVEPRRR